MVEKLTQEQQFLKDLEKCEERLKQSSNRVEQQLLNCTKTDEQLKQTLGNIYNYEEQMNQAIDQLAVSFGKQMTKFRDPSNLDQYKEPEQIIKNVSVQDIVDLMKMKHNIMFLTGAGISVASGIPTFRGNGGLWTQQTGQTYKAYDIATYKFYKENPELYWQWHMELYDKVRKGCPNVNHDVITKLIYKNSHKSQGFGQNITLVTQNIDGYHVKSINNAYNFTKESHQQPENIYYGYSPYLYQIHGNINYLRCEQCGPQLYKLIPEKQRNYPGQLCPKCKNLLRPHVLFFDETYDEQLYMKQKVLKEVQQCDLLFIIGTTLETALSRHIVNFSTEKSIDVVEINPQLIINYEKNWALKGKCEEFLPKIMNNYIKDFEDQQISKNNAQQKNTNIQAQNIKPNKVQK